MGLDFLNLTPKVYSTNYCLIFLRRKNTYMKNFKLLFLFLVILFVSTEAAPKGGRGGGGRGGGGYYGGGGGGGGGDFGELPTWLIILTFVIATIFLTTCIMCCINYCEDEDDEDNSNLQS